MNHFRYGLRMLARNPAFTAAAVVCLGLGTGATTAIFSVVDAVLLKPLPYAHAGRLVRVFSEFPKLVSSTSPNGFRHFWISPPEFLELRRDTQSFEALEGWVDVPVNLAGRDEPVRATASFVTGGLLEMLGVQPAMGRLIDRNDDRPNVPAAAVLSYDLWQRAFGGDPAVLHRDIRLNGNACTVAGIMPRGFHFPPGEAKPAELWVALQLDPARPGNRGSHYLSVLGRLRPGTGIAQAHAEMERYVRHTSQTIARAQHRFDPVEHPIVLADFREEVVHAVRPAMLVLLGAVAFVLLIACVNVANLLLARSEGRRREIAVRVAIGAGMGRLLRQFVAEGIILSAAGAALGLLVADSGLRILAASGAASIPRAEEIAIDWRVLLFSLALALATGLIFGLAPILHARPSGLHETLKSAAGRTAGSVRANRFRAALVSSELALALVLLIGSGLMVKAFWKLQEVNSGLKPDHLLTMQLALPPATYTSEAQADAFWSALLDRVRSLPGVESAAIASGLPPIRQINANTTPIENLDPALGGPAPTVDYWNFVDAAYFRTIGAQLVEGRFLTPGDARGTAPVAVINQTMARAFWPHESAIGHRLKTDFRPDAQWRTIVGVVTDVKNGGLDKPAGTELYIPYLQASTVPAMTSNFVADASLLIRTRIDPRSLAGPARAQVRALDRAIPIANLSTMEEVLARSVSRPRFLTLLMTLFSALSLVLAALGIYGVISYAVAQRTAEIGIRMALGARGSHVLRLVGRSGLRIALAGTAAGTAGALLLTRFLSGLLFGVSSLDPATFLTMAAVLAAVTLLACYVPARRASRIDPNIALRYE
ncbi:MAG TPA: ABC transporter permease [Bryobacteraceae bacterium]|jgi:putative ABC transport system permease protein|nr:ABC transporter permease [Bryobacteraceae bacterium]